MKYYGYTVFTILKITTLPLRAIQLFREVG